jgi:hypothetical protein
VDSDFESEGDRSLNSDDDLSEEDGLQANEPNNVLYCHALDTCLHKTRYVQGVATLNGKEYVFTSCR